MKILLIKRGALGDFIASTIAIKAVRQHFPQAHITLLSSPVAQQVCPVGTLIDEYLDYQGIKKQKLGIWKLIRRIREGNYDLAINLRWESEFSAFLTGISGAKQRVGIAEPAWTKGFYTHCPPYRDPRQNRHEYLKNQDIINQIGVFSTDQSAFIHITESNRQAIRHFERDSQLDLRHTLILAPTASNSLKAWKPNYFAEIGRRFVEQYSLNVLITWAENEYEIAQKVQAQIGEKAMLTPRLSIGELAALVERVGMCLCNNSGIMHVAYAVGTPLVCLNTSLAWLPYGEKQVGINAFEPDELSYRNRLLTNEQVAELLNTITPDQAWAVLQQHWEKFGWQNN